MTGHTLPSVASQHAEECALLWIRRDAAIGESHYRVADLAKLDNQLEGHLDGLRIAGDLGWDACLEELRWEEPGEIFAAAVVALESGAAERIDKVVQLGCSTPELSRGLSSAIAWTANEHAASLTEALLASDDPLARRAGVSAKAIRREDPGPLLTRLLETPDAAVRARSLRAAGELGRTDLAPACAAAATDEDDACRYWGVWAAARLGDRSEAVRRVMSRFAQTPGPFQERAARAIVGLVDTNTGRRWVEQLWDVEGAQRAATIAAGALGDPLLVGPLIERMAIDELARVAGEAFSMITGVDLAYDDLERDWPEGFEAGPTEDPADENVEMDADENLPWPHPHLVQAWWAEHGGGFAPGVAYLCGAEKSAPETAARVLTTGFQRQRIAAAAMLGLARPDRPTFEARARGDWQQKLLPAWVSDA
ncbi:MAG: TIGR02270 family protein [Planctomycetota bacterium]